MAVPNAKKAGILQPGTVAPKVSAREETPTDSWKTWSKASSSGAWGRVKGLPKAKTADAPRYRVMEGDALRMETWGVGLYDLVIVPHYLHLLDGAGVRTVLDKAREALKPDGR